MKFKQDYKLEENFWINEFLDNRDMETPSHIHILNIAKTAKVMQRFRDALGRCDITSGFRGKVWNRDKRVNGSVNSYHLDGLAIDFQRYNDKGVIDWGTWTPETLFAVANIVGFNNIGVYVNSSGRIIWVHVDLGKQWPDGTVGGWKKYSDTMSCRVVRV